MTVEPWSAIPSTAWTALFNCSAGVFMSVMVYVSFVSQKVTQEKDEENVSFISQKVTQEKDEEKQSRSRRPVRKTPSDHYVLRFLSMHHTLSDVELLS